MIIQAQVKEVERLAQDFFDKLGAGASVKTVLEEDGSVSVLAELKEPQMLIGEGGQTLLELQHLLHVMARKITGEQVQIALDINEYRKSKESYLRNLANDAADEVVLLKKEKELPPMPPRDRRIVHMVVEARGDVVTESRGEEPERRVIIRPKVS